MIYKAYLHLRSSGIISDGGAQVNAHKVNSTWDTPGLQWANRTIINPTIEDYITVNSTAKNVYTFDITSIAKDWYLGSNNGLALQANNPDLGHVVFDSAQIGSLDANGAAPFASIYYTDTSGLESYWDYSSHNVGRAGTGYVNNYNGNLIFIHEDLAMSGSRMPISLQHVFNSNYSTSDIGLGYGWRLNLNQTVQPSYVVPGYLVYQDSDGTKHFFKDGNGDGEYEDESGLNLTLNKGGDGSYTIRDEKDNIMNFSVSGLLTSIKDSNGNTLTIGYTGNNITSVTDGAGRKTVLEVDNATKKLNAIVDPSGRRTSLYYNTASQLDYIIYPDGVVTDFEYFEGNNHMKNVKNFDNTKITYQYTPVQPYRIKKVLETNSAAGTLGKELNVDYKDNTTVLTDHEGRKTTYQFNDYGNTVGILDYEGKAVAYSYKPFTEGVMNNKVDSNSQLRATVVNYLRNHSIETIGNWYLINTGGSTGSGSITSEVSYTGKQSLKITKTNAAGSHNYIQKVTLEKGKTYTLSAYMKTLGITKTSNYSGAHMWVYYKDASGVTQAVYGRSIQGTENWQRNELTFTLPANAASAEIEVDLAIVNETGTAYFDAVQLEDGPTVSGYNLLENSNFSDGELVPNSWTKNSQSDTSDSIVSLDLDQFPIERLRNKVY